jgi:iron complex outermembrane receptor protein
MDTIGPGNILPEGTVYANVDTRATYKKPTWRFALDQKFGPDIMLYGSVSRGFKSGVYNLSADTSPPVKPEVLTAYEAGIKTELFDHTIRFNLGGFHYDYQNIQLSALAVATTLLLNAANARINGGEMEIVFVPRISTGHLEISGNLSLLDGKYENFLNAPISRPNPAGGNFVVAGPASGNQMIRSPKATFSLGASYSVPVGPGTIELSGNFYHNSGFPFEADNRLKQPPYNLLNGEASYSFDHGKYRVKIFGKNITNQQYFLSLGSTTSGDFVAPQPPQTYGIGLDVHFGGVQ